MEIENDVIHPRTSGFLIGYGMGNRTGVDDALSMMSLGIFFRFFSGIWMKHVAHLPQDLIFVAGLVIFTISAKLYCVNEFYLVNKRGEGIYD